MCSETCLDSWTGKLVKRAYQTPRPSSANSCIDIVPAGNTASHWETNITSDTVPIRVPDVDATVNVAKSCLKACFLYFSSHVWLSISPSPPSFVSSSSSSSSMVGGEPTASIQLAKWAPVGHSLVLVYNNDIYYQVESFSQLLQLQGRST